MAKPGPRRKSKTSWEDAKEMAERGMGYAAISKETGHSYSAISARSARERWLTPTRRAAQLGGEGKDARTALELQHVAESIETRDENTTHSGVLLNKVDRKMYADDLADYVESRVRLGIMTMPVPRTWRDLNTADMIVRRARGMDKTVSRTSTIFNPETGMMGIRQEVISHDESLENAE